MNNRFRIILRCFLALLISLTFAGMAFAGDSKGKIYSVTITNLTKKQVITPPVLISHKASFQLFTSGDPASAELAALAEGGDTQPLTAMLGTRQDVFAYAVATGPVLPGEAITLEISTAGRFNRLSLAGMLATSNDAFFAVNGSLFPRYQRTLTPVAYDAGSEANTELCTDLPGPPCPADSGNARVTNGAEGFIYVHNGIHGVGDLNEANMDWHNPVVKIVIKKMRK